MGCNTVYDWDSGISQARAYREMACVYYRGICKEGVGANDPRFSSGIWSVCIAWAFSCEISLKLL